MSPPPFPILFITATRIGDAILSSGLIHRLSEEIPGARFTIVAGPAAAPLFEDVPGLEALIPFEKSRDGGHWFRLWNTVRRKSWGLVVDLRGSAISSLLNRRKRAVYRRVAGPIVHKVIEAARVLGLQDPERSTGQHGHHQCTRQYLFHSLLHGNRRWTGEPDATAAAQTMHRNRRKSKRGNGVDNGD